MMIHTWVNIASGNVLLPDDTKPLPKPILTSWVKSGDIHLRALSEAVLINNKSLKIEI